MASLSFSQAPLGPLLLTALDVSGADPGHARGPTLYTTVDYLIGPALHAITGLPLIAAALAHALGAEFDGGACRLFRLGIGLASHAVQIMNFLFG